MRVSLMASHRLIVGEKSFLVSYCQHPNTKRMQVLKFGDKLFCTYVWTGTYHHLCIQC